MNIFFSTRWLEPFRFDVKGIILQPCNLGVFNLKEAKVKAETKDWIAASGYQVVRHNFHVNGTTTKIVGIFRSYKKIPKGCQNYKT